MTYRESIEAMRREWRDRKVIFEGAVYTVLDVDYNGALLIDKSDEFKATTAVSTSMVKLVDEQPGKASATKRTLCESCELDAEGIGCKYACTGVTEFDMEAEVVTTCDDYKKKTSPGDTSIKEEGDKPMNPFAKAIKQQLLEYQRQLVPGKEYAVVSAQIRGYRLGLETCLNRSFVAMMFYDVFGDQVF